MTHNFLLIKSNDDFRGLERIWNDLLSQSPANNYFLTWEWLWNWWNLYAEPNDKLTIILVQRDDDIIGIAPFYVRKTLLRGICPARRMMFLGTQEYSDGDVGSDYMDIIFREGEERSVVDCVFSAVVEQNLCDDLFLSKVDVSSKTFSLIQEKAADRGFLSNIVNEYSSPYIALPSTWDDYLKNISSSMRRNMRHHERSLESCNNVIYRRTASAGDLERDFDELVNLHERRWDNKGIEGAFSNSKFTMFHKQIMPVLIKKGFLELVFLSEDNENRAVVYNICYKNKIYVYQVGRHMDDRKIAFGHLLHFHCIEDAIRKGLTEYDFLPSGKTDTYKDYLAKKSRKVSDLYIARHWAVKNFVRAESLARSVYIRVKPYLRGME